MATPTPNSTAMQDTEALTAIGLLAFDVAQAIPGLPNTAQSAIIQAVTQVMGEAYLKDRARYFTEDTPGASANSGSI